MLGNEYQNNTNKSQHKMDFSCSFIIHPACYEREKVVEKSRKRQGNGSHQYQMKVSYYPIAVMGDKVERQCGIYNSPGARGKEQHNTTNSKHHRSGKLYPATPHCCKPVK